MVAESRSQHPSEWSAIVSIAGKIGCTAETLRRWIRSSGGSAAAVESPAETQRIRELERENRELRRANEILKLASAFFAQAELDRRLKS
jgi:transposase-like protein